MARTPSAATLKKREQQNALEAVATDMATVVDPTGAVHVEDDKPKPAEVKKAIAEQFAEADAKGDPSGPTVAEATLSRAIRGY